MKSVKCKLDVTVKQTVLLDLSVRDSAVSVSFLECSKLVLQVQSYLRQVRISWALIWLTCGERLGRVMLDAAFDENGKAHGERMILCSSQSSSESRVLRLIRTQT